MQLLSSIRVFSRRKIKHKFNDLVNRSTNRIMQQKSTNVGEDNCKIKPNFLKDVVETVSWDINIGTQNGLQNLKRHAYFSGQNTWKAKNNSPYHVTRFWVTTCTYNLLKKIFPHYEDENNIQTFCSTANRIIYSLTRY